MSVVNTFTVTLLAEMLILLTKTPLFTFTVAVFQDPAQLLDTIVLSVKY